MWQPSFSPCLNGYIPYRLNLDQWAIPMPEDGPHTLSSTNQQPEIECMTSCGLKTIGHHIENTVVQHRSKNGFDIPRLTPKVIRKPASNSGAVL